MIFLRLYNCQNHMDILHLHMKSVAAQHSHISHVENHPVHTFHPLVKCQDTVASHVNLLSGIDVRHEPQIAILEDVIGFGILI